MASPSGPWPVRLGEEGWKGAGPWRLLAAQEAGSNEEARGRGQRERCSCARSPVRSRELRAAPGTELRRAGEGAARRGTWRSEGARELARSEARAAAWGGGRSTRSSRTSGSGGSRSAGEAGERLQQDLAAPAAGEAWTLPDPGDAEGWGGASTARRPPGAASGSQERGRRETEKVKGKNTGAATGRLTGQGGAPATGIAGGPGRGTGVQIRLDLSAGGSVAGRRRSRRQELGV